MIFVRIAAIGVALLLLFHLHFRKIFRNRAALPFPGRILYYLLSFTWGFPATLLGVIPALLLFLSGVRPEKFGPNYCFYLPVPFGLELGIFFIAPKNASFSLKAHELGHQIQNIWFGPLFIPLVSLPSAIRYWMRAAQKRRNPKRKLPPYDAVWFENQATASRVRCMRKYYPDVVL